MKITDKFKNLFNLIIKSKFLITFPPILWLILFLVFPLVIVLKISFASPVYSVPPFSEIFSFIDKYSTQINLNFESYARIFKDVYYLTAFVNSIILAFFSTLLCLILGFPIAYGISCAKKEKRIILLLLISFPFWISSLVKIYAWENLFAFDGPINRLLLNFHIIENPIRFLGNFYAVYTGMIFCYIPIMIFPIYSALEKIDNSYIEAASNLGCSPAKVFWKIIAPFSKHGIASGCILVFFSTIGEFAIPELLGGPDTIILGRVLWMELFNNVDWPMACSLSIITMLFVALPVFIFRKKY
ncbi:MAG: ABC transporter permease subunit [Holosporales bacterium]|jgi:putrescine transport system permease protein|nr:ABC transporter permease subunit [Holosporales bacterium]